MKRLLLCLSLLFPINAFAFDVEQLAGRVVTSKVFTKSDSMEVNRYIQSTQGMVDLFGAKRVDLKTRYVYQGEKDIDISGDSSWRYFFPDSWDGRGKGKLIYNQNDVMRKGMAGDTLVVADCDNDEVLLILIEQGHPAVKEVYKYMVKTPSAAQTKKPSLFARIFGKSKKVHEPVLEKFAEEYAEEETLEDLISTADLSKTDVEIFRNNKTGKLVISGTPTKFTDGDTIHIQEIFRARISSVDAPESKQNCINKKGEEYACGIIATDYLKKIVGKSKVICTHLKFETFGRHLWDCQTANGKNLAREMIRGGHAVVSTHPPILYDKDEEYARKNKLGIWSGEFQHPHCWRHLVKRIDGKENKTICGTKEFWTLYPDLKSGKLKP